MDSRSGDQMTDLPVLVQFDMDDEMVDRLIAGEVMGIDLHPPLDIAKCIVAGQMVRKEIRGGVILSNDDVVQFPHDSELYPFPEGSDREKNPKAWQALYLAKHVLWNHPQVGPAFRQAVMTYEMPLPPYSSDEQLFTEVVGRMAGLKYRYAALYGGGLGVFVTFMPEPVHSDPQEAPFETVYKDFSEAHNSAIWVRDRSFPRAGTLAALVALGVMGETSD